MGEKPDIERQIAHLASRQHGNITRKQLLALGLARHAIDYRVGCGRLFRVHNGVYAVGRPPNTPLERAAAAVLACGPGAVLSHRSAMTLWGFSKHWNTPFDVTVPGDRRTPGITVHRSKTLAPRDKTHQLGIPVTSPARTLVEAAPGLTDRALTRAVNDARLSGYLTLDALAEVTERLPRHPGTPRLRLFVETRDPPTRSILEDDFPAFCKRYGLPEPLINARVAGYEVDALFVVERVIVELDGWEVHSSRTAFENDRDRDADTLVEGHVTVRITRRRVKASPEREADRLHAILAARRAERDLRAEAPRRDAQAHRDAPTHRDADADAA